MILDCFFSFRGIFGIVVQMEGKRKMYTYKEVIDKIENAKRFGNLPGIEITKILLEELGHPEKNIPFVHVAGTNGKGSTCAFLGSILSGAGYKVGVFTSPHLIDFEERITISGDMISKETVTRLGNQLLELNLDVHPTMFDYCLAMALLYFKEQNCDLMILETGLGGSKDSTTAVGVPLVSVITKIGYDHMELLGDSLEKIAGEKAGILKAGTKLVTEIQEPEAMSVILEQAANAGISECDMFQVSENELQWVQSYKLGLRGVHQVENAAAAVLAVNCLEEQFPTTKQQLEEGLLNVHWRGRLELLSNQPFLLIDGAHNAHGVHALKCSLQELYPNQKFHFIMGVMADKDYPEMIAELLPLAVDFVTVTPDSSRALQSVKLAKIICERGVDAKSIESVDAIWDILNNDGYYVAFGSLYFIGELMEKYQQKD